MPKYIIQRMYYIFFCDRQVFFFCDREVYANWTDSSAEV